MLLALALCLGLLTLPTLALNGDREVSVPLSSSFYYVSGLDLADLSCSVHPKTEPDRNPGAAGYLWVSMTVNGPANVNKICPVAQWPEVPSETLIEEYTGYYVKSYKEANMPVDERPLPKEELNSIPIFEDNLRLQYVLLIGIDADVNVIGYMLVETDLTGIDPASLKSGREHTLPTATQYVPYQEAIPASLSGGSFALTSGSLPAGLSLSADGVLTGFPEELGVFSFTVTETAGDSSVEHKSSLSTYSRMYAEVEASNPPGYGFVETEGDDGHVQDQTVSSVDELTDQVMHCQGPFPQFRNLYLDGRRLVRDVEYHAEEGSTKITIYAETIGEEGGGTHTIAAEFETDEGETVYTVQNYTVYGIASTDVHVEVTGEVVIWTDAEPYIDENSRTMTPFRVVGDALGLTIAWDSAAREASFTDGTKTIWFPIGSTAARTSEGTTVEMDTSAVIVNGRTYAPVRYLAQYFGYSVGWDAPTRTVKIG